MAKRKGPTSTQMNTYVQEQDPYEDIPCFLRSRLKDFIDKLPWMKVWEKIMKQHSDPPHEAYDLHCKVLEEVDRFISTRTQEDDRYSEADVYVMKSDLRKLNSKFGNDSTKFVCAMVDCMQKEGKMLSSDPMDELEDDINLPDAQMNDIETSNDSAISDLELQLQQLHKHIVSVNAVMPGPIDSQNYEVCISGLCNLVNRSKDIVNGLVEEKKNWENRQKLGRVGLGPEAGLNKNDFQRFRRFAAVLNTLLSWFYPSHQTQQNFSDTGLFLRLCEIEKQKNSENKVIPNRLRVYEKEIHDLEKFYITNMIVVSKQPPEIVGIQNSKQKGDEQDPNVCDSPATPSETESSQPKETKGKSYSSKKLQRFEFQLYLPGGEEFSGFSFKGWELEYVHEIELATMAENGLSAYQAKISDNVGTVTYSNPVTDHLNAELKFVDIGVEKLKRINAKVMSYQKFIRIRSHVEVAVNSRSYEMKVLSLPFHFNTGSIQLLGDRAALMWYLFSSEDMYNGDFKLQEKLSKDEFLRMLDLRIRYVDDNNGRWLRGEEKKFLIRRLHDFNIEIVNDQISLADFNKRVKHPSRDQTKEKEFSFHDWYHAVVCTIKARDLNAWISGALYGLIGEKESREILMSSTNIPVGKFILRYSTFYIDKLSTLKPKSGLAMDYKKLVEDPSSGQQVVDLKSIPVRLQEIDKYGVYNSVVGWLKSLTGEVGSYSNCTAIYGYQHGKRQKDIKLSVLKDETAKCEFTDKHYRIKGIISVNCKMEDLPRETEQPQPQPKQNKSKSKVARKGQKGSSSSLVISENNLTECNEAVVLNTEVKAEPEVYSMPPNHQFSVCVDVESSTAVDTLDTSRSPENQQPAYAKFVDTSKLLSNLEQSQTMSTTMSHTAGGVVPQLTGPLNDGHQVNCTTRIPNTRSISNGNIFVMPHKDTYNAMSQCLDNNMVSSNSAGHAVPSPQQSNAVGFCPNSDDAMMLNENCQNNVFMHADSRHVIMCPNQNNVPMSANNGENVFMMTNGHNRVICHDIDLLQNNETNQDTFYLSEELIQKYRRQSFTDQRPPAYNDQETRISPTESILPHLQEPNAGSVMSPEGVVPDRDSEMRARFTSQSSTSPLSDSPTYNCLSNVSGNIPHIINDAYIEHGNQNINNNVGPVLPDIITQFVIDKTQYF